MSTEIDEKASDRTQILLLLQETIGQLHNQFRQQQDYLTGDDVDAFIQSMAENQSLLAKMESLMQSLHDMEIQAELSRPMVMEKEISRQLRELQETEKQTTALAQDKLESYRNNIRNAKLAKKGIKSYLNPYTKPDGMYFDKKK